MRRNVILSTIYGYYNRDYSEAVLRLINSALEEFSDDQLELAGKIMIQREDFFSVAKLVRIIESLPHEDDFAEKTSHPPNSVAEALEREV